MKKLVLLILAIGLSFVAKSQLDSFDISNFILPDLKIRSNEFNLGFHGNGSETQLKNLFTEESKISSFNSVLNLGMVWKHSEESRKFQKGYDLRLNFSPNFQMHKESGEDIYEQDRFRLPIYVNGSYFNRYYFKPKTYLQYSIPYTANIGFDYSKSKENTSDSKSVYLDLGFDINPELLLGFGRVENVGHAWHAIRILEDLHRFNRLSRSVDSNEILELANLIAERNYTRYYDYRLKNIEDLEIIESKLAEMRLMNERDIRAFNSLRDMLFYGINATRLSGKSFAFGLTSGLYFNGHFIDSDIARGFGGIGLKLEHRYHKPISQQLQIDAVLSISSIYSTFTDFNEDYPDLENGFGHRFNANASFGWFPNTRTHFRSLLDFQISNRPIYNLIYLNQFDGLYSRTRWSNSLHYYVSPRVRLTSSINLEHYYLYEEYSSDFFPDEDNYHNGFNYMFNFGYSYMIY